MQFNPPLDLDQLKGFLAADEATALYQSALQASSLDQYL